MADPNTGVTIVGGTSAASPLVAAIFASSGHGAQNAALIYANPTAFYDVTSGNTNAGDDPSWTQGMCNAGSGWDGPPDLARRTALRSWASPAMAFWFVCSADAS